MTHPPMISVNGLPLPQLLVDLLATGGWRHPGDEAVRRVIPFLSDAVDFLSIQQMEIESRGHLADNPSTAELFHDVRGARPFAANELPWRDVTRSVMIAVNREPGADVAIALDYRTSLDTPRVIASNWQWEPTKTHQWALVSHTFPEFWCNLVNL